MSKKSSPGAGPTRRPRRTGSRIAATNTSVGLATRSVGSARSARSATRSTRSARFVRPTRPSSRPDSRMDSGVRKTTTRHVEPEIEPAIPTLRTRIRTYLPVALLPNGVVVAVLVAMAIAGIMLVNAPMAVLPTAVAQSWLALNAAPIIIQGHHIGIMPLMATAILVVLVASRVRRAVKDRVSLADLGVIAMVVLIIPSLLTLIATAMLYDAAQVFPVEPPNIAMAWGKTLLVQVIALVLGMGVRLWKALAKRFNIAESLVDQAVSALWLVGYALVGAIFVGVGSLIVHASLTGDIMNTYTTWGKVAIGVVSLGYLPNAAIATLAVTAGSEVVIGTGLVSVFGVNLVPLPPLPMFAVIPAQAHTLMAGLLAVPVCAAVLALMKRVPRLVDVPGLVLFVALDMAVLTSLTYGELGIYGVAGPRILLTTGLMAGWVFVVSLIIAIVGNWVQRRLMTAAAAAEREAELLDGSILDLIESEDAEGTEDADSESLDNSATDDSNVTDDPDAAESNDLHDATAAADDDTGTDDATEAEAAEAVEEKVKPDNDAIVAATDMNEDNTSTEPSTAPEGVAGPKIAAGKIIAVVSDDADTDLDGENTDSDIDTTIVVEVEPHGKNH